MTPLIFGGVGLAQTAIHPQIRFSMQPLPFRVETDETLANIGLPPNREGGNQGFLVHKTDGKLHQAAQGGCGHIHAGDWEEQVASEQAAAAKSTA